MPPEALEEKRAVGPLVHCLSNSVTANDCVNPPLAGGVAALSRWRWFGGLCSVEAACGTAGGILCFCIRGLYRFTRSGKNTMDKWGI